MPDFDWFAMARSLGYDTPEAMFRDLYLVQERTTAQLVDLLGVSRTQVLYHLKKYNIARRSRGGNHNLAPQRRKLYRMDQRVVFMLTLQRLCKLTGADQTTVWLYRNPTKRRRYGILHHQSNSGA